MLEVRGLQVTYGARGATARAKAGAAPVEAVRGVDLELARGRTLALVGQSGSGKSATGLALMGLLPPGVDVQGSVRLHGSELLGLSDAAMSRHRGADLGMVFQDPSGALDPVLPIGRQIEEALRVHGMPRREAQERTLALLDLVGLPAPRRIRATYPHELSGGQRQRVAIAIAVANAPAVVIADEPTTALDTCVQAQVLAVLRHATDELGAALLLITHDLAVVAGLADDVTVIHDGRIVESAPADRLYAAPEHPWTRRLLAATPRLDGPGPARSRRGATCPDDGSAGPPARSSVGTTAGSPAPSSVATQAAPAAPSSVGTSAGSSAPSSVGTPAGSSESAGLPVGNAETPLLEAHGLVVSVDEPRPSLLERMLGRGLGPDSDRGLARRPGGGRRPARQALQQPREASRRIVDGVDLEVFAGECLALVGESGAGKSSTLRALMDHDPRRADAGIVRLDGAPIRDAAQVRTRLHRAVQLVFQDSGDALDPRLSVLDLVGEPLTVAGMPRAARTTRVLELLARVGLDEGVAGRFSAQLSGGQRQRVAIARALATTPRLLLLDEPVSALDVVVQAEILDLLAHLQADLDLAYVVVAHDLALVRRIADRVAVMFQGRIVESGPAHEVLARPRHPYTRALVSAVPIPDPARERARRPILLPEGGRAGEPGAPDAFDALEAVEAVEHVGHGTREPGCPVVARCPLLPLLPVEAQERCRSRRPALVAPALSTGREPATTESATADSTADARGSDARGSGAPGSGARGSGASTPLTSASGESAANEPDAMPHREDVRGAHQVACHHLEQAIDLLPLGRGREIVG